MKSRVTIKDIAQKTGFSVTTISLVLNDKANHIPRETKLIIAKAVKEMGYRPNKMAVRLGKKAKQHHWFCIYRILEISFFHIQLKF